jgi:hypothetical protein
MQGTDDKGYFAKAIAELTKSLGTKEPPIDHLVEFLYRGEAGKCVTAIARQMGLPIDVRLSFVAEGTGAQTAGGFHTQGLSRTDSSGRGIHAVTAQVLIPPNLPLFGSSMLTGYPVTVRVGKTCFEYPHTFITVMAHELSHVLLHSLKHPERQDEIYTDLAPLLLGFSDIVARGRTVETRVTEGTEETTRRITYGYLTDAQFALAHSEVQRLLRHNRRLKREVEERAQRVERAVRRVMNSADKFGRVLGYLARMKTTAINARHFRRSDWPKLAEIHGVGYAERWPREVQRLESVVESISVYCKSRSHYTEQTLGRLRSCYSQLEAVSAEATATLRHIESDNQVLRRSIGWVGRARLAMGGK